MKTRHDMSVKVLHEVVLATSKLSETRQLEDRLHGFVNSKGNRLVLDQIIIDWTPDHEDYGLDLAICHPCVRSYLPRAKDEDLAAAEQRGGGKMKK